jgi:hypothetical protein
MIGYNITVPVHTHHLILRIRRHSRIVGLHCGNGFMSPFWGLEFRGGFKVFFGTFEAPWKKEVILAPLI